MTEFLHELIKKQNMNQLISEMVDEASDPWRYSEPPPPFTGNENAQQLSDLRLGPY
jgi:hypothetical protein